MKLPVTKDGPYAVIGQSSTVWTVLYITHDDTFAAVHSALYDEADRLLNKGWFVIPDFGSCCLYVACENQEASVTLLLLTVGSGYEMLSDKVGQMQIKRDYFYFQRLVDLDRFYSPPTKREQRKGRYERKRSKLREVLDATS